MPAPQRTLTQYFPLRYFMPAVQEIPPQIVLAANGQKRAYGRQRLSALSYEALLTLFATDFNTRPAPHTLGFTFYRTHGADDRAAPRAVDADSWPELARNVTRIELRAPRRRPKALVLAVAVALVAWYLADVAQAAAAAGREGYAPVAPVRGAYRRYD